MKSKADDSQSEFRPHFKTHQSPEVGEIYREMGISKITVSSIDMATFFMDHGWKDITIAFPVNIRQIDDINNLANNITLNLLIESSEVVEFLRTHLTSKVNIWIKIDIGYGRTGVNYQDRENILDLTKLVVNSEFLEYRGLLTHAGHAYTPSTEDKQKIFDHSNRVMAELKEYVENELDVAVNLSYGDTPTCSQFDDFKIYDEIRPGNFAYYDLTQMFLNSCSDDQIAVIVACPVVAKHKADNKVIIHGGGVHFSKDYLERDNGKLYGYLAGYNDVRWAKIDEQNYLFKISQDHGEVKIGNMELFDKIEIGDLLYFYPVHSCMTADLMRSSTILLHEE